MMYANVNANDSAKPKRYKPETGGILPQMADVVEWIATADNRATWTFETSTRTGLFAPVRAREEGFSDITTRGGNHSTGGSFRRSTRVREGEFLESIKRACRLSPTRFMVIAHQQNLVPGLASR